MSVLGFTDLSGSNELHGLLSGFSYRFFLLLLLFAEL